MDLKFLKVFLIFLFFFSFPIFVKSANPLDLVINEISWMGNKEGWYFEWVELYNNTNQEIDLSGWEIENAGIKNKSLEISGKIPPKSYFLICKKEIGGCDFISWNLSLNDDYKKNGRLILKNKEMEIFDSTPEPSNSQWPAGNKEEKRTMERKNPRLTGLDPNNWQTSQYPGGTPKVKNIIIEEESGQNLSIYPFLFINEILPFPADSDAEEFIEIFNQNDFEVDLSDWKIVDTKGKTKTYSFPKGTKISAKGFLVLKRETTKIVLNNEGDGLNLIQPDGKIGDQISYEMAPKGKSYNRTETGWVWSLNLTPGSQNNISIQISKESFQNEEKELAAIGQKLPQSLIAVLIAFSIAILSGIIFLILKRRFIKENKI